MSARATPRPSPAAVAQAWIELQSDDPVAVSALATAREHLAAGASLMRLRRFRLFELRGKLPDRTAVEELLHRSTQFYNPHKERCQVRTKATEAAPVGADEQALLVVERGGERRPAAERWWRHETGSKIEVREGVAYLLGFEEGVSAPECAADLAAVRDRRHGLLCNPHSQNVHLAGREIPLPWITVTRTRTRSSS